MCLEKMKDSDTKSAKMYTAATEPVIAIRGCEEGQASWYRTVSNCDTPFPLLRLRFWEPEYFRSMRGEEDYGEIGSGFFVYLGHRVFGRL